FADWLAADPLHAQAIERLQGHLAPLHALPALPAGKALRRAGKTHRASRVATSLALASLVGLSALMTTTVPAMGETIALLHRELPEVKVIVGGAVLTQAYAHTLGADGYAKDAMASVRLAERFLAQ
ncbi:MAG: cobalamin-dependent protein, partial [Clostridia bacterium]